MRRPAMRIQTTFLALITLAAVVAEGQQQVQGDLASRAQALVQAQDWEAAAELLQAWVEAEPGNGQAWLQLARSCLQLGQHERALESARQALDAGGTEATARLYAARALAGLGDGPGAAEQLRALGSNGSSIFTAVVGAPEIRALRGDTQLEAAIEALHPCTSEQHRQFDFWLGSWTVTGSSSGDARNRISKQYNGCLLREEYKAGAFAGTSLSYYDAGEGRWHQNWVDNLGQSLRISGGLVDGSMVLSSEPTAGRIQRITWTPLAEGRVRQLWERSTDGGETWSTVFDGLYSPAPSASEP